VPSPGIWGSSQDEGYLPSHSHNLGVRGRFGSAETPSDNFDAKKDPVAGPDRETRDAMRPIVRTRAGEFWQSPTVSASADSVNGKRLRSAKSAARCCRQQSWVVPFARMRRTLPGGFG
jgi:hypothetical protein